METDFIFKKIMETVYKWKKNIRWTLALFEWAVLAGRMTVTQSQLPLSHKTTVATVRNQPPTAQLNKL